MWKSYNLFQNLCKYLFLKNLNLCKDVYFELIIIINKPYKPNKMRKLIYIPILSIFCITILFVSCKPSAKEEAAQENVTKAKDDLAKVRQEANEQEWQSFKYEVNNVIAKNDERIAELKKGMNNSTKSADIEYQKKVNALKAKNDSLKLKMKEYKNDANSNWQSFKSEFNHDMEGIGNALNDLTIDNKN